MVSPRLPGFGPTDFVSRRAERVFIMYHAMIYEVQKIKFCLMKTCSLHLEMSVFLPDIYTGSIYIQFSSEVLLHFKKPKGKTDRETLFNPQKN